MIDDTRPHLDVDVIADVETMRKNPLWWKPKQEKTLAERLENRAAKEPHQKRRSTH